MGERLHARFAQSRELLAPLGDHMGLGALCWIGVTHRPASLSPVHPESIRESLRGFDLRDLQLALRATRHLDGDHIAALVTDERLADRRLVRELALSGIGFRRADDLEL